MIAQLRVIFTTAFAPWVAAIGGVLAAVVNGFSRTPFWIGDPLLTAEWWEASFYLLAIPTCAMLAFDTAAQTGPGATSVLSTGRFTARWRAQLLAVTWVLSVLPTFAAFVYFSLQFEDFRYTREINDAGGRDHALVFEASVAGRKLTGCDFLHVDDDGLIDDFTVMVRPLSAATALADAMGAQFERIQREATAQD